MISQLSSKPDPRATNTSQSLTAYADTAQTNFYRAAWHGEDLNATFICSSDHPLTSEFQLMESKNTSSAVYGAQKGQRMHR